MIRQSRRLMNPADDGADLGGTATVAPPAPAAPAPAPAPAASVLSAGAAPAPAPTLLERFPEKYRVVKEDGSLDIDASTGKLLGGYGELSKRFGAGDVAPAAPADYKVNVPEAMKDTLKDWDPAKDDQLQGALADFHKAGLSQGQVDAVMAKYFDMAPRLAQANAILTPEQQVEKATADLKGVWKDDATFKANLQHAHRAAVMFGAKAGLSFEQIEESGLGNNPAFMRILAAIGPELGEDTAVQYDDSAAQDWQSEVHRLRAEKDGLKEKDPRRADLQTKINALYEKRYPSRAAS
jgi:hypothetical protein